MCCWLTHSVVQLLTWEFNMKNFAVFKTSVYKWHFRLFISVYFEATSKQHNTAFSSVRLLLVKTHLVCAYKHAYFKICFVREDNCSLALQKWSLVLLVQTCYVLSTSRPLCLFCVFNKTQSNILRSWTSGNRMSLLKPFHKTEVAKLTLHHSSLSDLEKAGHISIR